MDEKLRSLKDLEEEDIIWYIYFFIVIFALIANNFEKKYLDTNNLNDKLTGRKINIVLLTVALGIYFYFYTHAKEELDLIKRSGNPRKIQIAYERIITNIVFVVAGLLALYTELDDNSSTVDLAIF